MAITQIINNLDIEYQKAVNTVIINDIPSSGIDDINNKLFTVLDSDVLSSTPRCECGNYSERRYLDRVCPMCGTPAVSNEDITPVIWIRRLDHKFINPSFWAMLNKALDNNTDILRYLSDASYNPKRPEWAHNLIINGIRSYENLVNNMEKVIKKAMTLTKFKKSEESIESLELLLHYWDTYKSDILSSVVPIPNKSIFVMEATNKGKFINLVVGDVINIVNEWLQLEDDADRRTRDKYMSKTVSTLSNLGVELLSLFALKKPGIFRKNVFGGRAHFTYRCTATSLQGKHYYDEMIIPWSIGLTTYEPYVLNKLMRRGYKHLWALRFIYKHIDKYHKDIDEILDEIVDECPLKGLATLAQRNPTLLQGSAQLLYGRFGKDPSDKTVKVSFLIANSPNLDFDGDNLNLTPIQDMSLVKEISVYRPHFNIPNLSKPFSISNALSMQPPADGITMSYLKDKEDEKEDDSAFFEELLKGA